jgi:ribonuclease HI
MSQAGWRKLVGFVPASAVEQVAAAVFAAGGGGIGNYKDCAFAGEGTGWFTPLPGSDPTIGEISRPERTPEVRWETVVPRSRLGAAVRAFVESHPYEEPAFDVYAVEDVLPHVGLGRVGRLPRAMRVDELAELVRSVFELRRVSFSGDGSRLVARVGILPGGGRSFVEQAAIECEVLVTGDLSYHMGEQSAECGLSLIDTSHGELEWWAFQRWAASLADVLAGDGVSVTVSREWRSPWTEVRGEISGSDTTSEVKATRVDDAGPTGSGGVVARADCVRVWIDGGSRGNPGPSAIGVVLEGNDGEILQTISRVIGIGTNNVAEYKALLTGLDAAARLGAQVVEVVSDSELLVRQMRGEYKVKNEGLKSLYEEARARAAGFCGFSIRHVERKLNARADALVNQALDDQAKP